MALRHMHSELMYNGHTPTTFSHFQQGEMIAERVFNSPRETWPDGIIITDDVMASGALPVMEKQGDRIGHDVYVVSHCNARLPILTAWHDKIDILEYDSDTIARAIFSQLRTLINGEIPAAQKFSIDPTLHPATGTTAASVPRLRSSCKISGSLCDVRFSPCVWFQSMPTNFRTSSLL